MEREVLISCPWYPDKITEYAELDETHKDNQVQLPALHKTIPKSHTMYQKHCPNTYRTLAGLVL